MEDGIYAINDGLDWHSFNEKLFFGCSSHSGDVQEIYEVISSDVKTDIDSGYTHCLSHKKWDTDYALVETKVIYYGSESSCNVLLDKLMLTYAGITFDFSKFGLYLDARIEDNNENQ